MKRYQLFELHEMDSYPRRWRDFCTDFLSYLAGTTKVYQVIGDKLRVALVSTRATRIVDLCSGGAMPILTVRQKIADDGPVQVIISDKYPNVSAFRSVEQLTKGDVSPVFTPVDAMNVSPDLEGFRTIFTSFHHFDAPQGKKILLDALKSKQGIGVFEYTERNFLVWGPLLLFLPLYVFCVTPFIRPFSWKRLFWTYLVPVIPLTLAWDCFVSCLRTYTPAELQDMVEQLPPNNYSWQIGKLQSPFMARVTYLLGWPEAS